MLRFARVAGSADEQLILAYPVTDINGEPLLPAGFLDDLMRRLDEPSSAACIETHARFDPILIGEPGLAHSAADARVLAVALACHGREEETLRTLASRPQHFDALRGTADAFEVAHRRRVERAFTALMMAASSIPGRSPRSARSSVPSAPSARASSNRPRSCPFQFYQRYVLGLKMIDGTPGTSTRTTPVEGAKSTGSSNRSTSGRPPKTPGA